MRTIGLYLHYFFRVMTISYSRFRAWQLQCYLQKECLACGSVSLAGPSRFANVFGLTIGHNVHINEGAYWVCDGGLVIGDNTIFARNVTIYTRNHNYKGVELPFDHQNIKRPVRIGRNVWVGANVTILPGADIGDGVIVGAGAVVGGSIAPCTIIGAPLARKISERDQRHYEQLDANNAYHTPKYRIARKLKK